MSSLSPEQRKQLNGKAQSLGYNPKALYEAAICRERIPDASTESKGSRASIEHKVVEYGHWLLSLGVMYAGNKAIAQATAAAGISFPSPLIGTGNPDLIGILSRRSFPASLPLVLALENGCGLCMTSIAQNLKNLISDKIQQFSF